MFRVLLAVVCAVLWAADLRANDDAQAAASAAVAVLKVKAEAVKPAPPVSYTYATAREKAKAEGKFVVLFVGTTPFAVPNAVLANERELPGVVAPAIVIGRYGAVPGHPVDFLVYGWFDGKADVKAVEKAMAGVPIRAASSAPVVRAGCAECGSCANGTCGTAGQCGRAECNAAAVPIVTAQFQSSQPIVRVFVNAQGQTVTETTTCNGKTCQTTRTVR